MLIGVGNRWRGDDAAGIEVARRAGGIMLEGECSALLDAWATADDVVVVDAARAGSHAGAVHRFDAASGPLPAALMSSSTHAFGVADAVELARALDRLPPRLRVLAIEGESFALGSGLSAPVERAVTALSAELSAPS